MNSVQDQKYTLVHFTTKSKKRQYPVILSCSLIEKARCIYNELLFRQRPTLPGSLPPSTISAEELNFRVRNGNGWVLFAIITGYLL